MKKGAYFFRNIQNYEELIEKTKIATNNKAKQQKFDVIEKIILTNEEFIDFQNSFNKTKDFIKRYTSKLVMNNKAEYLCLLVVSKNYKYGFLVNSSGYSYARMIAIINLGENLWNITI